MNTLPAVVTPGTRIRRRLIQLRSARYFWVGLISYLIIALLVLVYLNRAPTYSSAMSVVLPGSSTSSNFAIDEVGQANQSTKTPFGSMAFSPLVNYKQIIRGRAVLEKTADKLNTSVEYLRAPRVELTERSSILSIYLDGSSPDKSQAFGWALYQSFQEVLNDLRADEVLKRDASIKSVLEAYRARVAETRQAIIEFQQRALLISDDQIKELMRTITSLDEKHMTLVASSRNTEDYVNQLSLDLGISPALAGQAFKLQSDAEFRGLIKELDSSAARVAEYSSRWGVNHQKVVAQTLRYETAKTSLLTRSQKVVGRYAADALYGMDLQTSPNRAELFSLLVENFAKLQGNKAEIKEVEQSLLRLNDRLKIFSREAAELERLEREHGLAEAVFTSAAAKLEAGRADVFASYPAVQLLSVPSLPNAPKSPNTKIAIAMGFLGILFVTFGLVALWHRHYFIKLLLKND